MAKSGSRESCPAPTPPQHTGPHWALPSGGQDQLLPLDQHGTIDFCKTNESRTYRTLRHVDVVNPVGTLRTMHHQIPVVPLAANRRDHCGGSSERRPPMTIQFTNTTTSNGMLTHSSSQGPNPSIESPSSSLIQIWLVERIQSLGSECSQHRYDKVQQAISENSRYDANTAAPKEIAGDRHRPHEKHRKIPGMNQC